MKLHSDNMSVDGGFDALDYGYANAPALRGASAIPQERDLWCAVIAQAFIDMGAIAPATSSRKPHEPRAQDKACDEAARWLLRDKTDFAYICDLAGVSPHIIRRAAQIFYGRTRMQLGALHTIDA